jgi:hypothetical protein
LDTNRALRKEYRMSTFKPFNVPSGPVAAKIINKLAFHAEIRRGLGVNIPAYDIASRQRILDFIASQQTTEARRLWEIIELENSCQRPK